MHDNAEFGLQGDGLVQDCSNASALAMELLQSSTKPLMYPAMDAIME